MNKQQIIEKILQTLEGQKFADWYNHGRFDQYVQGVWPEISQDIIKEEIAKIFHLDS